MTGSKAEAHELARGSALPQNTHAHMHVLHLQKARFPLDVDTLEQVDIVVVYLVQLQIIETVWRGHRHRCTVIPEKASEMHRPGNQVSLQAHQGTAKAFVLFTATVVDFGTKSVHYVDFAPLLIGEAVQFEKTRHSVVKRVVARRPQLEVANGALCTSVRRHHLDAPPGVAYANCEVWGGR